MNRIVVNTVKAILATLVKRDYDRLYELDREKQLSAELIENAIKEYGGHITMPPHPFPLINIYRQPEHPNALFTDVQLWIDGQESDLTMQCTLFKDEICDEQYAFAVTDILVM
jgi:hypothetical protein